MNDFGDENQMKGGGEVPQIASNVDGVSQLVSFTCIKDSEVSDMELTNCEMNTQGSPQESFSLCSPESLLKPGRAHEVTQSSMTFNTNNANSQEESLKYSNGTMDITCMSDHEDITCTLCTCTHSERSSSTHSTESLMHVQPSKSDATEVQSSEYIECDNESSNGTCNIQVSPSQSVQLGVAKADTHTTSEPRKEIHRIPPNVLKMKQTPSKPTLLVASPYMRTPQCEGIVHHIKTSHSPEAFSPVLKKGTDISTHPLTCNWLQDADNTSFALVDSSPSTQIHAGSMCQSRPENSCTISQSFLSQLLPAPLPTRNEVQKAVATIKANTQAASIEHLVIESPEIVPIQRRIDPCATDNALHFNSLSTLNDITSSQEDCLNCQSLMMSPSIFSKFLTNLKCDRSIHFLENTELSPKNVSVCVLSPSLDHSQITRNAAMDKECAHGKCVTSSSSRNVTAPFSVLLEMLQER